MKRGLAPRPLRPSEWPHPETSGKGPRPYALGQRVLLETLEKPTAAMRPLRGKSEAAPRLPTPGRAVDEGDVDPDLLAQARRIAALADDLRVVQSLTPEKIDRLAAMLDSADDETALEGVVAIFDLLDRMERVCP